MTAFILRRLIQFPLVLLFLITISFFLMRLAPGGPFSGERQLPAEIKRNIDRRYGFQRPMLLNFNYFSDLADPVRRNLAIVSDPNTSDKLREAARGRLSGFDAAAIPDLVSVVLNGPDELRHAAAAAAVDVAAWDLEEELREQLRTLADPEADEEDRSQARKAAATPDELKSAVLADFLMTGTGGFQSQVSNVLGELVGHRDPVPGTDQPQARKDALRRWREWWRSHGADHVLPTVFPDPGPARERALDRWKTWWDASQERYTFSFLGKTARIADSQFLRYLRDLACFDLGPSFKYKDKTVNDIIREHMPASIMLGSVAILFALIMGLTAGVIAGMRQNSAFDYASMSVAMIGLSVPMFVVGPILVLVFALYLGIFNAAAWDSFPRDIILPAFTLALPFTARIARLTRAGMLEVIHQDYIRVARAKGLRESVVIVRHALKGALLPVVSFLGPGLAMVLTGSLVVEEIFGVPGIGKQFVKSALNRDYFVAMGVVILFGSLLIFFNLVVDILYGFLDPRIRYDQ
jgi:oligopeptide transport system permease protein